MPSSTAPPTPSKTTNQPKHTLFLRAATVYRISRHPYPSPSDKTSIKRTANERQKQAYLNGTALWATPLTKPSSHTPNCSSTDDPSILIYARLPQNAAIAGPCPVVLMIAG
ncbi:hypothetical protein AWENTII_000867 [Aspergillus wentii]